MKKKKLGKTSPLEVSAIGLGCDVDLTPADLEEIESVAAEVKVQGARYPRKLEAMTGR